MWISLENTETIARGEVLGFDPDATPEGVDAEWLGDEDLVATPVDSEDSRLTVPDDDAWLPDWILRQKVDMDAEEVRLKAQHTTRIRRIKARRAYLQYAYGERLEARVRYDLDSQAGDKKSVDYAYGRSGLRKANRVDVTDRKAAIGWARAFFPDAVKTTHELLKGALTPEAIEESPGVHKVDGDEFYPRLAK